MGKALTAARAELGEHAPRIEMFKIPTDKIREVIGTGGKVIREIVEKTGAKINIEDDGSVKVASADGESIKAAIKWIKSIASDPELGKIYEGKVVKVMDFGAFVNFFGAKDGLVHISQLACTPRQQGHRRRQGRRQGEGQAARHGRARQGAPVDEGGRSDHRRGPRSQAKAKAAIASRPPAPSKFHGKIKCERAARMAALFFDPVARPSAAVSFWHLVLQPAAKCRRRSRRQVSAPPRTATAN